MEASSSDYRLLHDYPAAPNDSRHGGKKKNRQSSYYQQQIHSQNAAAAKPALRELFAHYARFGDPHSTGHHITLAQTDKWFRQAGIVDNWNVTATDTAISYRKVSRYIKNKTLTLRYDLKIKALLFFL